MTETTCAIDCVTIMHRQREGARFSVRLRNADTGTARALLLAGEWTAGPVARYGPFVMNNQA